MSELHKFVFDGLPVRGMLVRLDEGWQELLRRRAEREPFAPEVRTLLGEMTAAAVLMQANIKFKGALVLQVFGDGPLQLVVAEVQPELAFRATATVAGAIAPGAGLGELLDLHGRGRCAITLDPRDRQPGQQPYQGIVPLRDTDGARLPGVAAMLELYMRQSEQLRRGWCWPPTSTRPPACCCNACRRRRRTRQPARPSSASPCSARP